MDGGDTVRKGYFYRNLRKNELICKVNFHII